MEHKLDGQIYQVGVMNAMTQLHVTRKLGPAMHTLQLMLDGQNKGKDITLLVVLLLSNISDSDVEYVLDKCLSVVSRKQDQGWAAVQSGGELMFSDMSMNTLIQLTSAVIVKNLGDFFVTALANLERAANQKS